MAKNKKKTRTKKKTQIQGGGWQSLRRNLIATGILCFLLGLGGVYLMLHLVPQEIIFQSVRTAVTPLPPPPTPEEVTHLLPQAPPLRDNPPVGENAKILPVPAPPQALPSVVPPPAARPRIAIVIDDLGLDRRGTTRATALPAPVTLAFLPYAGQLQAQVDRARDAGHEILLHMPMQPSGKEDAGPDSLQIGLSEEEIRRRMNKALDAFQGYDGVNNHMGSRFTAEESAMDLIMPLLRARGMFFLDSRTAAKSAGLRAAQKSGVPVLGRDIFLDDDMSAEAVVRQLQETEHVARRRGVAIAIGHPHPATLAALERWLPTLPDKGFELMPVKALFSASSLAP